LFCTQHDGSLDDEELHDTTPTSCCKIRDIEAVNSRHTVAAGKKFVTVAKITPLKQSGWKDEAGSDQSQAHVSSSVQLRQGGRERDPSYDAASIVPECGMRISISKVESVAAAIHAHDDVVLIDGDMLAECVRISSRRMPSRSGCPRDGAFV